MTQPLLKTVTIRELNRRPAAVLERVRRGERLIVCRRGRPVATLQPFDGTVAQPDGTVTDIRGNPIGDVEAQLSTLSEAQRALLLRGVRRDVRLQPYVRLPIECNDRMAEVYVRVRGATRDRAVTRR